MNASLDRDERTLVVENASFRWAYQFVSFGLLVLVGYRSFARGEAAWDLMALVVLGGVVASAYQWSQRVLTVRWLVNGLAGMFVAAVIAALIVLLRS
jgi:hypothetical protein